MNQSIEEPVLPYPTRFPRREKTKIMYTERPAQMRVSRNSPVNTSQAYPSEDKTPKMPYTRNFSQPNAVRSLDRHRQVSYVSKGGNNVLPPHQ